MKLTLDSIRNDRAAFEAAGYQLPTFDYETVKKNTCERPVWIHFGAGNIFRAFQANVMQNLLNDGSFDRGLIVAEGCTIFQRACTATRLGKDKFSGSSIPLIGLAGADIVINHALGKHTELV